MARSAGEGRAIFVLDCKSTNVAVLREVITIAWPLGLTQLLRRAGSQAVNRRLQQNKYFMSLNILTLVSRRYQLYAVKIQANPQQVLRPSL